jgi:hypothetical protein
MPATYEPIQTISPTTNPTEILFSSIPSTYTDLVLVVTAKVNLGEDIYIRVNADSGTNYSATILYGTGSTAGSDRVTSQTALLVDYYGVPSTANNHLLIANFNNYSNATTFKTCLSRSNNAASGVDAVVSLWRSTAAITSLNLGLGTSRVSTFSTSTVATLYGIKAA